MAAERVSGHCALLYHPNNSISLRESFRFQTTPTGCSFRHMCQGFFPLPAKHRISHCRLALFLISLSSFPCFPMSLLHWKKKPLIGRWANGDWQCSMGRKLIGRDWERIWNNWMVLTWWENQCTLPVYLHLAELRSHSPSCLYCTSLSVWFQLWPLNVSTKLQTDFVLLTWLCCR